MPPLENPREELVAQGLAMGKSKTQACKEAGFGADRGNASRRTAKASIKHRVAELQQAQAKNVVEKFTVTNGWIVDRFVENVNRALQAECPRDADGNAVGSYSYNGAVANKALEMLARIQGMLVERAEVTHKRDYENLSNLELLRLLAREAQELQALEAPILDAEALD